MYRPASQNVSLPDGDAVEFKLPVGSREHYFRLADETVEWQISSTEALVTAGSGAPQAAGESFTTEGPFAANSSLFLRQDSGGAVVVHWMYLVPVVR